MGAGSIKFSLHLQMPPKSILKKEGKPNSKSIVWDENAIAQHDLERGGRMKINEPKTPFIHYSIESDTVLGTSIDPPPMELEEAVEKIKIEPTHKDCDWSSGEELETENVKEEEISKKKREEFNRRRRFHYNMKNALSQKVDDDDDETMDLDDE